MLGKRVARIYNKENPGNYIQEKPCHPYSVRIYRYSGCISLPETDNGKTLRELKFKRNEIITLYKNKKQVWERSDIFAEMLGEVLLRMESENWG